MENKMQNTLWRLTENVQTIYTECSRDFILPDSYPDIRKILYTTGTLCPERTYIDNGRFTDSGTLVCKLLFADENNEVHSVSFSIEYSASLPIGEDACELMVAADQSLRGTSARLLNPRKLSIKGNLAVKPRIFCQNAAGPKLIGDINESSIEKQSNRLPYWKLMRLNERSLEASEDLSLQGDGSLQEIVFSHLNMGMPSCEAVNGSIRFTGEAVLELLYRNSDGSLRFAELPIPFHSSMDAEVTTEAICTVRLIPEKLSCRLAEDATGEAHGVVLDFTYSVSAWAAIPSESMQVTDCYSIACPTETEEGSATVVRSLRKMQKQMRRMLTGQSEGLKKCMKAFAAVYIDSEERIDGKLIAHCIAEVTLLGSDEEGAVKTLTLKETFPWEIEESDEVCMLLQATADPVTEAEEVKVTLTVTAELLTMQKEEVRYVTAIAPSPDRKLPKRSAVTLCYPLPGEGLWEIAKRYALPQSVLLAANSIGEGALPQVLLIPSERKALFSKMIQ